MGAEKEASYSLCSSVMSQCVIRSQELQGKMSKVEASWRKGELSDSYPLLGIYSTKEISTYWRRVTCKDAVPIPPYVITVTLQQTTSNAAKRVY